MWLVRWARIIKEIRVGEEVKMAREGSSQKRAGQEHVPQVRQLRICAQDEQILQSWEGSG
jgi:hypothetical protein